MHRRGASALVVALLVLGALGGPAVGSAPAQSADEELTRTATLSLTPETPGEIGVSVRYDVPDSVTEIRTGIPERAEDVRTDGFERDGDAYEWTGESEPSIEFALPVNRTAEGVRSARNVRSDGQIDTGQGLTFADAGPWAIAPVPSFSTEWSWRGENVSLTRETEVAGPGVVGDAMAYLGPSEQHTRTAEDQQFTLVVPDAASLDERPDEILDVLADAAALRVGGRDRRVVMVAAPTGPDWGPSGLQYGENAAWVRADAPLESATNTWLHEYVHTRQAFDTTAETRWLTEGSARYYTARLALEADLASFGEFRRVLRRGTEERYDGVVLAEPESWTGLAQYAKGALVAGELDRRLRLATDGATTSDAVFARLNARSKPLTGAAYLDAVAAASPAVRDSARRYAETTATPAVWDVEAHEAAFGQSAPRFAYEPAGETPYRVTGPYRNGTYGTLPTLVAGETLRVNVTVENVGSESGTYNATLAADGRRVDSETGALASGARRTVTLRGTLDAPASELRVGWERIGAVREPARPRVADLTVGERAANGSIPLTATVVAPDSLPAGGPVAVSVNNTTVAERRVALGPGERETLRLYLDLGAGEHVIRAGQQTLRVTVPGARGLPVSLGPVPAAVAVVLLALLWRVR